MTDARPRHIRRAELPTLDLPATRNGGSIRYLRGLDVGLNTSIFEAEIAPGSGPPPHHHPYGEVFVLISGRGRYEVGASVFEAESGDVVIVPTGVVHSFRSTGDEPLRQTTVHEAPEFVEILAESP